MGDRPAELVGAGLATLEEIPGAQFPYIRFHPTLLPYLRTLLTDERRATLEERYWQRYYALAGYFYREDKKNPHFIRALAQRDLPNLRRGLDLALQRAAAQPDDPDRPGSRRQLRRPRRQFLDLFGLRRERERLGVRVDALLARRGPGAGLTQAEYLAAQPHRSAAVRRPGTRGGSGLPRAADAVSDRTHLTPAPLLPGEGGSADDSPPLRVGRGGRRVGAWAYERAVTLGLLGRALAPRAAPPTPPSATGRSWPRWPARNRPPPSNARPAWPTPTWPTC